MRLITQSERLHALNLKKKSPKIHVIFFYMELTNHATFVVLFFVLYSGLVLVLLCCYSRLRTACHIFLKRNKNQKNMRLSVVRNHYTHTHTCSFFFRASDTDATREYTTDLRGQNLKTLPVT